MTDLPAVSHAALVALVRGLQFATFVTWASVVFTRGGSLLRVLFSASRSRWDRQWSSLTFMAATLAGFALRWLIYGEAIGTMSNQELAWWAVLYLSTCCSAIGVVIEHGWWTDRRHRAAMWFHAAVIATSVTAAALVG